MNILDHLNASVQLQNKLNYRKAFLLVLQQLAHLLKKKLVNLLLFGHWYFFSLCINMLSNS